LVSLLDPEKIGSDEVDVISGVTGSSADFVENLVDLVEQANDAEISGIEEDVIVQNFSKAARKIISENSGKKRRHKNFSSGDAAVAVEEAAEIVGMLDDDALDTLPASEIAAVISDATGTPESVVECMVDIAQNNFSAGRKFEFQNGRKINRTPFVRINFNNAPVEAPSVPEMKDPDPKATTETVDPTALPAPVVANTNPQMENTIPATGSEGLQQNPQYAENDPKDGEPMSSPTDAGEAMAIANELATVQEVADVPEGESNFSRKQGITKPGTTNFSTLKAALGDKYIPN